MGCTQMQTVSRDSLKSQLMRVKYASEVRNARKGEELKKGEKILSLEFIKPLASRNKSVERVSIMGNARTFNQKNVYFIIQNEAKLLLDRANLLDQQSELPKIKDSINNLLFCSSFMNFEELSHFTRIFKSKYHDYPFPKENDIKNELIREQYSGNLSFKLQMEYVFQYSLNHEISMDLINEIGHNYKYGAEKYGA